MPEGIASDLERQTELLKGEFEKDVQVLLRGLGDQPLFGEELPDEDKNKKIELVWDDAAYWGQLIDVYGYRNAKKASDEMLAFLRRK